MTVTTDGIIIRQQPIGEYDKILTVLTRENGIIRAFANGARRSKNKRFSSTEIFSYCDFTVNENKDGSYIIKECTPKKIFFSLVNDIDILSLAQYMAELLKDLAPQGERADEYLSLILNSLYLLTEKGKNQTLVKTAFELRLLCLSGFMPNIVACRECGNYESEQMYFDCFKGDLYCSSCKPKISTYTLSAAAIKAMRHICLSSSKKIFSFSIPEENLEVLSEATEKYLKAVTLRTYKTLDFYKKMKKF